MFEAKLHCSMKYPLPSGYKTFNLIWPNFGSITKKFFDLMWVIWILSLIFIINKIQSSGWDTILCKKPYLGLLKHFVLPSTNRNIMGFVQLQKGISWVWSSCTFQSFKSQNPFFNYKFLTVNYLTAPLSLNLIDFPLPFSHYPSKLYASYVMCW